MFLCKGIFAFGHGVMESGWLLSAKAARAAAGGVAVDEKEKPIQRREDASNGGLPVKLTKGDH
jgi:hypothetical protein